MIYPETAKFVVEIIKKVKSENILNAEKQDEERAKYRPYIGDDIVFELKKRLGEIKA